VAASILIWIIYSLVPQLERKPVLMPVSSTIYRGTRLLPPSGMLKPRSPCRNPSTVFFLTDVEKVVEKVLSRNLKGRESEL